MRLALWRRQPTMIQGRMKLTSGRV